MLGAVMYGHTQMQAVVDAIIKLAEKAAKEPWDFQKPDNSDMEDKVKSAVEGDLQAAYQIAEKMDRQDKVAEAKTKAAEALVPEEDEAAATAFGTAFKAVESGIVRGSILETKKRIDGRVTWPSVTVPDLQRKAAQGV